MAANHDCLPILSCNAEEEDVGGTTERVNELPSAQKEMETNENEVSPQKQWTSFTDIPTAFQPRGAANLMAAITVHCPTEYAGDGRMQSNAPQLLS